MIGILAYCKFVPAVLYDSFKADDSNVKHIAGWLKAAHGDQYVLVVDNAIQGNSTTMSVDEQCKKIQELLKSKTELAGGFIAFGQSQGGYVWRHYLENYNDPPIKRLIAQASPMAGFYKADGDCFNGECNSIRADPYSTTAQQTHSLANYWRDPKNISAFLNGSQSLAKINNLVDVNEQRKKNFNSLDKLVTIGDPSDGVIFPWKSQFFGFFKDGTNEVIDFHQFPEWSDDLYGLRSVTDASKTYMYRSKLKHEEYYDPVKYHPVFDVYLKQWFNWSFTAKQEL